MPPPNQLFLFLEFGDNCNPGQMAYVAYTWDVERHLAAGERIIYRTKVSQVVFVWHLPLTFVFFALPVALTGNGYFALALWLISVLAVLDRYLRSDIVVTNRRVMVRPPYGKPEGPEVDLIEVRDVEFKPGILARLFDYGTMIMVQRQGGVNKWRFVPGEFYRQLHARLERNQRILK